MFGILAVFVQAAAGQIAYLALRLESGSFPRPLHPAEEQAAFAALQNGDAAARDRLISHNLRLVAHVVKKYYAVGGSDDLISIGTIGLIKAVNSFKPDKVFDFSSGNPSARVYVIMIALDKNNACVYIEPDEKMLEHMKRWMGMKMYQD